MTAQFRNLVFEGGGVKGIAYLGAMEVFHEAGLLGDIVRVGGTSAGAINALIYALGNDLASQRQILNSTDFKKFMDDSFGVIRDVKRLASDFGWFKGAYFSGWIGGLVRSRLGSERATFADLRQAGLPDLHVIGTNLSTRFAEVFSADHTPQMPLVTAVRITMSIPLFFAAMRHGPRKDVYVDGGVILNYPVKLFDRLRYIDVSQEPDAARRTAYYETENVKFLAMRPSSSPYVYNRQTLGMRLDTSEEIAIFRYNEPPTGAPIDSFSDYARALIGAFMQVQENQHLHGDDWQRTVYINTLDVKTTDFSLDDDRKEALVTEGRHGAETYLKWFRDPTESPVNRI